MSSTASSTEIPAISTNTPKKKSRKLNLNKRYLLDTIPVELHPRGKINTKEKLRKMIRDFAGQKPLPNLPLILWPSWRHPIYPPLFYWGISLPIQKIMDFACKAIADSSYQGPYAQLLRDYDRRRVRRAPAIDPNAKLVIFDHQLDNDGKMPIVPNQPFIYDILLIDFALACLEDHIGIEIESLRAEASNYRNWHPVLTFFSNYESHDSRMTQEEIDLVLEGLGIDDSDMSTLGWWCGDSWWTEDMKEP